MNNGIFDFGFRKIFAISKQLCLLIFIYMVVFQDAAYQVPNFTKRPVIFYLLMHLQPVFQADHLICSDLIIHFNALQNTVKSPDPVSICSLMQAMPEEVPPTTAPRM